MLTAEDTLLNMEQNSKGMLCTLHYSSFSSACTCYEQVNYNNSLIILVNSIINLSAIIRSIPLRDNIPFRIYAFLFILFDLDRFAVMIVGIISAFSVTNFLRLELKSIALYSNDDTDQWSKNKCDNKCDQYTDSNCCSYWRIIVFTTFTMKLIRNSWSTIQFIGIERKVEGERRDWGLQQPLIILWTMSSKHS